MYELVCERSFISKIVLPINMAAQRMPTRHSLDANRPDEGITYDGTGEVPDTRTILIS